MDEKTHDLCLFTFSGLFPYGKGDIFSDATKHKISATSKKRLKRLMKKAIRIGNNLVFPY